MLRNHYIGFPCLFICSLKYMCSQRRLSFQPAVMEDVIYLYLSEHRLLWSIRNRNKFPLHDSKRLPLNLTWCWTSWEPQWVSMFHHHILIGLINETASQFFNYYIMIPMNISQDYTLDPCMGFSFYLHSTFMISYNVWSILPFPFPDHISLQTFSTYPRLL